MEEAAGERPATATVRLQRSDTTVTVRCSDLVETNEATAARDAARAGASDARGAVSNGACWFQLGLNPRLSQCVCVARWPSRNFLYLYHAVQPKPASVWAGAHRNVALRSVTALRNLTGQQAEGVLNSGHQMRHACPAPQRHQGL